MIDDRGGKQRMPCCHVSFTDLRAIGFELFVQEFDKEKPNGEIHRAVKVLKVLKNNKVFPRDHMMELLRVMGIDVEHTVWVEPKRTHRCLSQKDPTFDYRYGGRERTDKEYLQSGRASMSAIMFASNMKDMQEQAEKLSNGGEDE